MRAERSGLSDQALQKIGRNVVCFQRMEKAIKSLIVRSNIRGHASDLAEIHRKTRESVDKRSMGLLVDEFLSAVYASEPPTDDSSSEIWASFWFRVEADEATIALQKEALSLVVKERNALIHQMLWAFDPNSDESCQSLILRLDGQHERLKPHYERVTQILGTLHSLQKEVLEQLEASLRPTSPGGGEAG